MDPFLKYCDFPLQYSAFCLSNARVLPYNLYFTTLFCESNRRIFFFFPEEGTRSVCPVFVLSTHHCVPFPQPEGGPLVCESYFNPSYLPWFCRRQREHVRLAGLTSPPLSYSVFESVLVVPPLDVVNLKLRPFVITFRLVIVETVCPRLNLLKPAQSCP